PEFPVWTSRKGMGPPMRLTFRTQSRRNGTGPTKRPPSRTPSPRNGTSQVYREIRAQSTPSPRNGRRTTRSSGSDAASLQRISLRASSSPPPQPPWTPSSMPTSSGLAAPPCPTRAHACRASTPPTLPFIRLRIRNARPRSHADMALTTYVEAIRQGLWEEMERDERVFILGEDVGAYGGAFKVTAGMADRFGA